MDTLDVAVQAVESGLHAQANPNTHGNHQGSPEQFQENWPTPTMQDGKQGGITPFQSKGGNHTNLLHVKAIKSQQEWRTPTVAEEKNQNTSTQIYLQNQVGATQKQWATPQASDHIEGARTALDSNQKCLGRDMKQWATPRSGKTTDENPETWAKRQANGDVATMPLTMQVKQWATPQTDDGDNVTRKSGVYRSLTRDVQTPPSAAKLNSQWVTQLMGLNLGWVSPSCPVSVIQNWPRFVSGWLKLTTAQTNSDCSETGAFQQQYQELF
jgi:hypothetical protein